MTSLTRGRFSWRAPSALCVSCQRSAERNESRSAGGLRSAAAAFVMTWVRRSAWTA